ncbi:hypothetical protein Bca4012_005834 [Brassica carinata]
MFPPLFHSTTFTTLSPVGWLIINDTLFSLLLLVRSRKPSAARKASICFSFLVMSLCIRDLRITLFSSRSFKIQPCLLKPLSNLSIGKLVFKHNKVEMNLTLAVMLKNVFVGFLG